MADIIACVVNMAQLELVAAKIARKAVSGDIVALHGDLGTGKTTFVRAALRSLGWQDEVPSPTFTLAQVYDVDPLPVWHFDLFRLSHPQEVVELGIEEAFSDGVSFIEWPERLTGQMPSDHLDIILRFAEDPALRHIVVRGDAPWVQRLAGMCDGP